jgi:short-subunit dehydrogenase
MPSPVPFAQRYGPWALVTGASMGIGRAFAHQLAARGVHVVMLASRTGPLEEAAAHVRAAHPDVQVVTAPVDLTLDPEPLWDALAPHLRARELGLLVCNAAHSSVGRFLSTPLTEHHRALRVNAGSVLTLVHRLAPPMVERRRGGIVLLASLGGRQGTPLVASYAATKAFDAVLAEGLWSELQPLGVDVLSCVVGATRTPGLLSSSPQLTGSGMPAPGEPDQVAREALDALGHHMQVVPGATNRLAAGLVSLLPRAVAVRLFARAIRQLYPTL